jgi:hypothetical protein
MSDFYSILRKSILDRGIADGGERDAIYSQARRAMIRRLWSFNPPLAEDEIERRVAAFDVAVSDIEADVMAAFSEAENAAAETYYDDVEQPAAADRRDHYETDYDDADRHAAERDVRDDREDPYSAEYREPEDRQAALSQRLPALVDPVAFGRQVREVGLYRYHEEARRLAPREPGYDDRYDEPPEEPEVYHPPTPRRGSVEVARRPPPPEPPPDPYEDEPGYGQESPRQQRRKRQQHDRWAPDGPRSEARDVPDRKPARGSERRVGPDDDRQRRKKRKRPQRPLSDRDKILMLLGAIGVCVLVLGGLGIYLLVPRDGGVTVAIDARHEVSDAATAVRLAAEDMPIDQTFMLFDGRDPTIFEASADNPVRFDAATGAVRVASSMGSAGVKAVIGPGLATRLAGQSVRVTIVARSSNDSGAAGMRFAYQSGVAISHWQTVNLGADYQAAALTWRVPSLRTDRIGDLLLIQPGVPGDGTGADIKSIKIDVLAN